ncbi:MAG: sugar phosphate isomerase/epimerase family protein [Bacteroidota bacterium]
MKESRRKFIIETGQLGLGLGLLGLGACGNEEKTVQTPGAKDQKETTAAPLFQISLAQWSLHRTIRAGKIDNLDFAQTAIKEFGIAGIEYVNQFFKDKAEDKAYLGQMKQRAADHGVTSLLIMIDGEGNLGDPNDAIRKKAVEAHYKWVAAAQFLGCHSIRVNAYGEGSAEEVQKAAVDGLGTLSEFAGKAGISVIVENHGSYSSNGQWLSGVMQQVNQSNCGTLPDFGNFCVKKTGPGFWGGDCVEEYDRYQGVRELMPFAKAVSAKSHDFDAQGNEMHTDFTKMMQIVKEGGYKGYVGVEYEGDQLGEYEGVMATKKLLEKVFGQIG